MIPLMNTTSSSISEVISFFGSQSELAKKLGLSPQAVQHWIGRGHIPIRRAIQIERLTDGKIRLEDIIHLTDLKEQEKDFPDLSKKAG